MNISAKQINKAIKKFKSLIKYIVLICITFVLLFPVLYMVTNSFMSSSEVSRSYKAMSAETEVISIDGDENTDEVSKDYISFKLIPDEVSFMQYYNVLLRKPKFLIMFWNSLIMTAPILIG